MPERRARGVALAAALAAAVALADGGIELRARKEPWRADETVAAAAREAGQELVLRSGARLGEVVLHETWRDFRGQRIAPGRYGLVYALQPRLKEHVGADAVRDFALLVPPDLDAPDDWLAVSRRVSGTTHPAVMALVPWRGEGEAPAELHEETPERQVLFRDVGGTALGFVVAGRAPEPDL